MKKSNQRKKQTTVIKNQLKTGSDSHLDNGIFIFSEPLSIIEFSKKTNIPVVKIIKYFFNKGQMLTQNHFLNEELIGELCLEFSLDFKKETVITHQNLLENLDIIDDINDLKERPPVVTIMGHVDHGKTTLLDNIRKSKITEKEFGGITQHIGAYQIKTKDSKIITFLDTPGHEAFTQMRARGAKVTDIVVLVVASNDGVMPQTKEAIDHAKAANVPIIVFVNKMDLPSANVELIMKDLATLDLISEEWSGDTIFVKGSALTGAGIDELLDVILLLAEMQGLQANPNCFASGTVIEAHLDRNVGPVCTLLVQNGTLKIKDALVAGVSFGRVRDMKNDRNVAIKEAKPSTPIEIHGLDFVSKAGEPFMVFGDDKLAREVALSRKTQDEINERRKTKTLNLENLSDEIAAGNLKHIDIILKTDTQGSLEALKQSLSKIKIDDISIRIIRSSVGTISESDITLAVASKALVYGFNVRPNSVVRKLALDEGIEIHLHNVIYKVIEELQQAARGLLDPKFEEIVLGQAAVRQLFHYSKVGVIAGCMVIEGVISRQSKVKVLRDGIVIYDGDLSSLKHQKEDIKESRQGTECGLTIKNFNDIKENDVIESYLLKEIK
ncbi:translation initiation factor IF-2 [Spiroplasma endosymbiont of Lonchoptera lutea]|uniref:translation initiation factor IF-2 n=1 Tax=Spiroplasma endosymbiont of Lonchoptera lutea TaxID=3066297 RepID=UPI0030CCDCD0